MNIVKLAFLLLILSPLGLSFISCEKNEVADGMLGASRPVYEDYSRSYKTFNGTTWSETKNGVKTTLRCNTSQCTFSYSNNTSEITYNYYFQYGNVYFTPASGSGDRLLGVITLRQDYKDILYINNDVKNIRMYDLTRE